MSRDTRLQDIEDRIEQHDISAGGFSSWLRSIRSALIKGCGMDVNCGECKACCTSSYFIHIRPEETQTLKRINKKILFPAPGLPKGNVLLGYQSNGNCPMLMDGRCSIYEHRPLTCRTYDCRIFTAAGIAAGEEDKVLITQRTRQWRFHYPTKRDEEEHLAVKAAAKFMKEHADCFPPGMVPNNSSQLAILALKVYNVFLQYNDEYEQTGHVVADSEIAKAVMEAMKRFDAGGKGR